MKLNNTRQIRAEDFEDEYTQLVGQLGVILNSFMQEVVEMSDGRVDFDNKSEQKLSFDITVNSSGVPTQVPFKVKTNIKSIVGSQVIRAYNLTDVSVVPTGQPFINFTPLGGGFIRIDSITGLVADNKYKITVIIY
jgi:hypothetical protein